MLVGGGQMTFVGSAPPQVSLTFFWRGLRRLAETGEGRFENGGSGKEHGQGDRPQIEEREIYVH